MKDTTRMLTAALILFVDVATPLIPVTAFFAVFVILCRPVFFRDWVRKLYGQA